MLLIRPESEISFSPSDKFFSFHDKKSELQLQQDSLTGKSKDKESPLAASAFALESLSIRALT